MKKKGIKPSFDEESSNPANTPIQYNQCKAKLSITSSYTQQGYDVERSPLWHRALVRRGGRMLILQVVLISKEWQPNMGSRKLTSQYRTKRIRCQCSSNNCQRIVFSNFTCYSGGHDMKERLYAVQKNNWPWIHRLKIEGRTEKDSPRLRSSCSHSHHESPNLQAYKPIAQEWWR